MNRWKWLMTGLAVIGICISGGIMFYIHMPGTSHRGELPPLSETEEEIRTRLETHVRKLAGEIGERNLWAYANLQAAADYLREHLTGFGYDVSVQSYTVRDRTVQNIVAEKRGEGSPGEIVVIGAHYDSVYGCPGANDNGSAVAALLETARLLAERRFDRTIRFVGFVNEEPPFFKTGQMGSRVYARRSRERGENIVAMISYETIGYYSDDPGSQQYPFPFSLFYPDTGNFIGFVGNVDSRRLVRRAIAAFREHTPFPSEGLAAPGWITGIGWSDHWAFWQEGYPGIMVTDTAPFRYPFYHTPQDTPDRIDYARTARVTAGLTRVAAALAAGQ